jgi:hypothetical protein
MFWEKTIKNIDKIKMISNIGKDVYRLYANAMPFNILVASVEPGCNLFTKRRHLKTKPFFIQLYIKVNYLIYLKDKYYEN